MNPFKDGELGRGNNMVRTMKSKFECNENSENHLNPSRTTKTLPSLSRQLSDPVKVKRTPAFRSDQKPFQRGHGNATSYREKKTVLKVNDKPTSVHLLRKQFDSAEDQTNKRKVNPRALTERSNSSAEIILNRCSNRDYENISALYTEPIPKNLRPANAIHNMSTLKISDKINKTDVLQNVQNSMCDDINFKLDALTDTLRHALNKPLPTGPAPQKPPRTFMHQTSTSSSPVASVTTSPTICKNVRKEFAAKLNRNLQKNLNLKAPVNSNTMTSSNSNNSISNKPDPRYMLEKLENALKNNRLRKRSSSTEGRSEVKVDNNIMSTSRSKINLNCLHSLNCTNNAYERLPEMKISERSVSKKDEPVYAEPFAFLKASNYSNDNSESEALLMRNHDGDHHHMGKSNRNSLYYMSTPISSESVLAHQNDPLGNPRNMEAAHSTDDDVGLCDTPSTSSQSSIDESPSKIKDLIKSFEENQTVTTSTTSASVDRIEKLEKQLRYTLDQSFNDNSDPTALNNNIHDNDDNKQDDAVLGKFETYVRTIKMITQSKQKFQQQKMFHCCLLVILSAKIPHIKYKYPSNAKVPTSIAKLVFPDSNSFDSSPKAQNYSLVITNEEGERIYGYCRRVLPEDSQNCLPLAYCILSKNRSHRFYNSILEVIESRHGLPDKDRDMLMQEFHSKRFPNPGETVSFKINQVQERPLLHYAVVNGGTRSPEKISESVDITLHQDGRHKENDLEELCQCLDTNLLLQVFAYMLLERKVILLSSQLGRLSICMEALQNILYPFSWPHTLIPVIPEDLWEIVEAPTPLICGVLSVEVVNEHVINDAIVIDLDQGQLLLEVSDEMRILPTCLVKEFKEGLILAKTHRNSPSKEKRSIYNVLLSDAFLRIFVHSCGHYLEYLNGNQFNLEAYVQHPKKKSIRNFLQWFTQTSMFSTFIDTITSDRNSFKIFESRTRIYRAQDVTVILEKMKDWRRD